MAKQIHIQTSGQISPMIYAYSTPGVSYHDGWVKIGYTDKQTVEDRIYQQTHTVGIKAHEEWRGTAYYDDGSFDAFKDHHFHQYLEKLEVEREQGTEWFHIDGPKSKGHFADFRQNRGLVPTTGIAGYHLRAEQERAVAQTVAFAQSHPDSEYLWNAKPRFGKTLSVYDFIQRLGAKTTLILTNRPAVANSWYDDYERFVGAGNGYRFVSETGALKGKKLVLTPEEYEKAENLPGGVESRRIEFISLQDLKGSIFFGGEYVKLKHVSEIEWDVLVVDEAHEGVDTFKTDFAFSQINRRFTLHLSGTPFKAIANEKFPEEAIYNWTYADEQRAKRDWALESANPYAELPQLNLYTYQMSEIVEEELRKGFELDEEMVNYAFDLNEFFAVKNGKFIHEESVDKFLDALTTQEKFPFSTPELRAELKHTFWLLNRVDSAKALAKKLLDHPVFGEYEIVLAAGDGKLDDDAENTLAYVKVRKAIQKSEKTITLSVGQLTTGVTIPEWTAVLMLANVRSPALYMQAAFRAQNPYSYRIKNVLYRKEMAYVFDFDPARTLEIYESFANDLSTKTVAGQGGADDRLNNVREALNFFPVVGEDPDGEMILLDAERVLSIPRKLRCREVVNRKFMSDFLFQNVSNVFHAPPEVIDLIKQLPPAKEPKKTVEISTDTKDDLLLDENGDVKMPEGILVGRAQDLFGVKIYGDDLSLVDLPEEIQEKVAAVKEKFQKEEKTISALSAAFVDELATPLVEKAKEEYGKDLNEAQKKAVTKKLKAKANKAVVNAFAGLIIEGKALEKEKQEKTAQAQTDEEIQAIELEFQEKESELAQKSEVALVEAAQEFVAQAATGIVEHVETKKLESEKATIESKIKDHLRGFSRTIPSFLMAYGDENTTLENFDKIIPPDVFKEVTSISVENFILLRDGGEYVDKETGEKKTYPGKLFDPVVFNDSVKRFLELKDELSNYFDEGVERDIFDYVPPQRTNQIFTPKAVVKRMVDLLEQENPGCFDQDDKTFADLYMKSGLYIAEIARRLFNSAEMKKRHPDDKERLKHIFERQLYGLAPTEIIYRIALNFLLGFDKEHEIDDSHFRKLDALEYAKAGTLQEKIDELFDDNTGS